MDIYKITEDNNDKTTIAYLPNILPEDLLKELNNEIKKLEFVKGTIHEKNIDREQIWYQNDGYYFCKKWLKRYPRWESHKYNKVIKKVEEYIQENIINKIKEIDENLNKVQLNSCLVNKYNDGTQFISPHRDSINSFGKDPLIIGLSIGAERTLKIRRLKDKKEYNLRLENNSIFIMGGASQRLYVHEIPKEIQCKDIRYSFTFREYIDI